MFRGIFPTAIIRLVDGATPYEGRVEVFHQCFWGSIVSDYEWSTPEANVVCRQLGFPFASDVTWHYYYGYSEWALPVYTDVRCNGDESSIDQCDHRGTLVRDDYYWYYDAVGVSCTVPTPPPGELK